VRERLHCNASSHLPRAPLSSQMGSVELVAILSFVVCAALGPSPLPRGKPANQVDRSPAHRVRALPKSPRTAPAATAASCASARSLTSMTGVFSGLHQFRNDVHARSPAAGEGFGSRGTTSNLSADIRAWRVPEAPAPARLDGLRRAFFPAGGRPIRGPVDCRICPTSIIFMLCVLRGPPLVERKRCEC